MNAKREGLRHPQPLSDAGDSADVKSTLSEEEEANIALVEKNAEIAVGN